MTLAFKSFSDQPIQDGGMKRGLVVEKRGLVVEKQLSSPAEVIPR
jgi:hypothetical protein